MTSLKIDHRSVLILNRDRLIIQVLDQNGLLAYGILEWGCNSKYKDLGMQLKWLECYEEPKGIKSDLLTLQC